MLWLGNTVGSCKELHSLIKQLEREKCTATGESSVLCGLLINSMPGINC